MEQWSKDLIAVNDYTVLYTQLYDLLLQRCCEVCSSRVDRIVEHQEFGFAWYNQTSQLLDGQFPIVVGVKAQIRDVTAYDLRLFNTRAIDWILTNDMITWFEKTLMNDMIAPSGAVGNKNRVQCYV